MDSTLFQEERRWVLLGTRIVLQLFAYSLLRAASDICISKSLEIRAASSAWSIAKIIKRDRGLGLFG